MHWFKDTLEISTRGKGLYPFNRLVEERIHTWGVVEGLCFLYMPHTSASLVISESYDPTAKIDMEAFMERLVPESQPWQRHTLEGPDDSPSHIRAMLTAVSLEIPIDSGQLNLGTWQGIYLFEHRRQAHRREVWMRCLDVK
jgi:secondary thiamine-phosphate synthase enzyme